MHTFSHFELQVINQFGALIAGVDEAGRGPLAGPVVAGAVILPLDIDLPGVADSKILSCTQRERLCEQIKKNALCWAIGVASVAEIDARNILTASRLAMKRAVSALKLPPDFCLLDGYPIPGWKQKHQGVIKGDYSCFTIAAASIIAKVHRDEIMRKLHQQYPQYGFDRHKGYPTAQHRQALSIYGPSPIHRLTFKLFPEWKQAKSQIPLVTGGK